MDEERKSDEPAGRYESALLGLLQESLSPQRHAEEAREHAEAV